MREIIRSGKNKTDNKEKEEKMTTAEKGNFGEMVAAMYLEKQGYEIVERNFRCRLGEVDIICRKGNQIVFIEVKTRTSDNYGAPSEAVNREKMNRIRKVAALYMMWEKITNYQVKFDVMEILLNHIENAF